jgi:molybdopterin-guanine dinucleotide biosynthesis protein A
MEVNAMGPFTKIKINGLVLAGGKSFRMKTDKALLAYHGKTQLEHCFGLLRPLCKEVYISIREEQSSQDHYKEFPQIPDLVSGVGPLGGILSALSRDPYAAWLVLACDLPFVNENMLRHLVASRDPSKIATAYRSFPDGLPEPLCAIYEPKGISQLLESLAEGQSCPRKIMMSADVFLIDLQETCGLENINHPEEMESILNI